jgi:hypothetical protein
VHAIAVAGRAQQRQIDRIVHAHAAGALHQRFDDHRGDVPALPCEQAFHVFKAAP